MRYVFRLILSVAITTKAVCISTPIKADILTVRSEIVTGMPMLDTYVAGNFNIDATYKVKSGYVALVAYDDGDLYIDQGESATGFRELSLYGGAGGSERICIDCVESRNLYNDIIHGYYDPKESAVVTVGNSISGSSNSAYFENNIIKSAFQYPVVRVTDGGIVIDSYTIRYIDKFYGYKDSIYVQIPLDDNAISDINADGSLGYSVASGLVGEDFVIGNLSMTVNADWYPLVVVLPDPPIIVVVPDGEDTGIVTPDQPAVPAPGSALLMSSGLVGLCFMRRSFTSKRVL